MNKVFFSVGIILFLLLSTLTFFYYRDVVNGNGVTNNDCLPRNLEFKDITSSSAKVVWQTSKKCAGFVKYGENIDYMSMIALDTRGSLSSEDHSIDLSDLKPGTSYYLYIFSDEKDYGFDGSPLLLRTLSY